MSGERRDCSGDDGGRHGAAGWELAEPRAVPGVVRLLRHRGVGARRRGVGGKWRRRAIVLFTPGPPTRTKPLHHTSSCPPRGARNPVRESSAGPSHRFLCPHPPAHPPTLHPHSNCEFEVFCGCESPVSRHGSGTVRVWVCPCNSPTRAPTSPQRLGWHEYEDWTALRPPSRTGMYLLPPT